MEKNRLSEEEKGKVRIIAAMCGGVIPAWAMPENDEEGEDSEDSEER